MTQEEIELLFQDLCVRLPYGVKVTFAGYSGRDDCILNTQHLNSTYSIEYLRLKPYLRPLSSMTEEEFTKLKEYSGLTNDQLGLTSFQNGAYKCLDFYLNEVPSGAVIRVFDWLNKHHFDYRDLIQMGLAIEAPKGMYNSKTKKYEQRTICKL